MGQYLKWICTEVGRELRWVCSCGGSGVKVGL